MVAFTQGKPIEYEFPPGNWNIGEGLNGIEVMPFRPKPDPKTRQWNCPEDVPGPVCWIRPKVNYHNLSALVVFMDGAGMHAGNRDSACYINVLWENSSEYEHSTDRKTWNPCTVRRKRIAPCSQQPPN